MRLWERLSAEPGLLAGHARIAPARMRHRCGVAGAEAVSEGPLSWKAKAKQSILGAREILFLYRTGTSPGRGVGTAAGGGIEAFDTGAIRTQDDG